MCLVWPTSRLWKHSSISFRISNFTLNFDFRFIFQLLLLSAAGIYTVPLKNNQLNFLNRIVFIHCRQHLCLDRLRTRIIKNSSKVRHSNFDENVKYAKLGFIDSFSPSCAINYIVTEVNEWSIRNTTNVFN